MNEVGEDCLRRDEHGQVILIIDDQPANLAVMSEYLEQDGFEILIARTGESGFAKAQLARPDLILLDVALPGMDGFETCHRLKAEPVTQPIPVIFMTVFTDTDHKLKGFQAGAVDYITKPFQQDEVLARVLTHLRLRALTERLEALVRERTAELRASNDALQQEIQERTRVAEALRESEARLNFALEAVNDAIWDFNATTDSLYWSPHYYTMLGYAPDEFAPSVETWRQLLHPADEQRAAEMFAACLANERNDFIVEVRFKTKAADWKWILIRGKVIARGTDGALRRMIGTHTDITERKQIEERVRKINLELEQRVQQRTAELEAVNQELREFAYVVSHDIKTPLRGMSHLAAWFAQDYAETLDAKGKEFLELLIKRVKRMDDLIDGILEYSRVGRGGEPVERIPLNPLIQDILETMTLPAQIRVHVPTDLPMIRGNRTRITQVLQNLIDNAVRFMTPPGGDITLRCLDEPTAWTFSVADNGPGIDPKYHTKIFQIFQTLLPHDQKEGTGIGLALVKKIVEFYGGKVWLESQPGEGSTFYFTIPKI